MANLRDLAQLPETIALFPLPGALLLPSARLPLNIFEPRYLAMVEDVLKTDHRLIGMVQPMSVPEGKTGSGRLHQIGCAGRIVGFMETDDGRYRITLAGISRFRVGAVVEGFTPYLRHHVDWSSFKADLNPESADLNFDRNRFMDLLARYFKETGFDPDWKSLKAAPEPILVNALSVLCPFLPDEKQALLEAPNLTNRRETLQMLLEFALRTPPAEGKLQ